ncbi:hypothetical protein PDIG_78280 [Penicillium digitatum PHI26]|uniref:Uncharacterized protein n=2 Tax=Penicillium digitatum TaxID=36651 RepID=K9FDL2_PEND2|nr:hypothetical protein PDIP_26700 [Penicillium digitatum Pd1]EKV06267.1 hypothetical protein PDIG_78280 [Penicillium digitatum PHI26]EKV18403.1 hypothetical protein PDIP_26700 [Penicillium digitatum Pd1]KAG0154860.1 hypothetical protein PDIDSM_431 [Penicillium digitatum]
MTDATFHTTIQDIRRAESKLSQLHGGNPPADSNSIIDQNTNKAAKIDKVKANLPLPDQPPVASDWNSFDQRITSIGSGRLEFPPDNSGLRGSAPIGSSASELGL